MEELRAYVSGTFFSGRSSSLCKTAVGGAALCALVVAVLLMLQHPVYAERGSGHTVKFKSN